MPRTQQGRVFSQAFLQLCAFLCTPCGSGAGAQVGPVVKVPADSAVAESPGTCAVPRQDHPPVPLANGKWPLVFCHSGQTQHAQTKRGIPWWGSHVPGAATCTNLHQLNNLKPQPRLCHPLISRATPAVGTAHRLRAEVGFHPAAVAPNHGARAMSTLSDLAQQPSELLVPALASQRCTNFKLLSLWQV